MSSFPPACALQALQAVPAVTWGRALPERGSGADIPDRGQGCKLVPGLSFDLRRQGEPCGLGRPWVTDPCSCYVLPGATVPSVAVLLRCRSWRQLVKYL